MQGASKGTSAISVQPCETAWSTSQKPLSLPTERQMGIEAGFVWREAAIKTVVYTDLGISEGMKLGIADAIKKGRPVEYRTLGPTWDVPAKES